MARVYFLLVVSEMKHSFSKSNNLSGKKWLHVNRQLKHVIQNYQGLGLCSNILFSHFGS